MGRKLRYTPPGGGLFEITTRTLQGRYLLRPSLEVREHFVSCLSRAQQCHPLEVVAAVCLSNHYHLLLWAPDAERLAEFMCHFNGNLARQIAREHSWPEKVWSRRYEAVLVSDEEEAQVGRLKYLLSQGVKECLVASPLDWPGAHCAGALLRGEGLTARWLDDPRLGKRGRAVSPVREDEIHVPLTRLPCWEDLDGAEARSRIGDLLAEIEEEGAALRRLQGIELGTRFQVARKLQARDPHSLPETPLETRPAPWVHAFRRKVREEWIAAYRCFVERYRAAADELRRGDRKACFPEGSFPPGLPFVRPGPVLAA